jgi:streptomycin 6-kinase
MNPAYISLFNSWGFVPEEELPGGHCSQVFADATRVAKVPWRGEEMTSGYRAAWLLSDHGGPKVIAGDEATGAVLMERIVPGVKLSSIGGPDRDAFIVVRDLVRGMADLDPSGCLNLSDYFTKSEPLSEWMVKTSPAPVFLHGDLHHENVLLGRQGWVVIDPKGLAGDPAFEAAAFMRNPPGLGDLPRLEAILSERLLWWADALDIQAWRIWGWSLAALREDLLEPESSWGKVQLALERMWPPEVPRL